MDVAGSNLPSRSCSHIPRRSTCPKVAAVKVLATLEVQEKVPAALLAVRQVIQAQAETGLAQQAKCLVAIEVMRHPARRGS